MGQVLLTAAESSGTGMYGVLFAAAAAALEVGWWWVVVVLLWLLWWWVLEVVVACGSSREKADRSVGGET
jgi:hypothetical protein